MIWMAWGLAAALGAPTFPLEVDGEYCPGPTVDCIDWTFTLHADGLVETTLGVDGLWEPIGGGQLRMNLDDGTVLVGWHQGNLCFGGLGRPISGGLSTWEGCG